MKGIKRKTPKGNHSLTAASVMGIVRGGLLSALLTAALTSFILNGQIGENSIAVAIFLIRALSVILGCLAGGFLAKGKYLQTVSFITLGYLIALSAVGIVFYDGSFRNFISGVLSVLTGGAVAFLTLQRPKRRRHNTVKYSR